MNAGNRDKHRLIAHRQERLGTGRVAGVGSCKAKVQKQDGWKWERSWTAAGLTDASQGLEIFHMCTLDDNTSEWGVCV